MTLYEFIASLFSTAALIVVALIQTRNKKAAARIEDAQARAERRAELRAEEARLMMELLDANGELTSVICIAVTGGHTNGNVEAAQAKYRAARENYNAFLRRVTSNQIK